MTVNERKICTYVDDLCKITIDSVLLLCNSGIPPILIVLFTTLTIYNVRCVPQVRPRHRRNVQLIRILLIQVIILVVFSVPITSQKAYSFITRPMTSDPYMNAFNSLINQISTELSYINNSITFYIYSLTDKRFRRAVRRILCAWRRDQQIGPC